MFRSAWGGLSHMFEFRPVMHCQQIFQNRHREPWKKKSHYSVEHCSHVVCRGSNSAYGLKAEGLLSCCSEEMTKQRERNYDSM